MKQVFIVGGSVEVRELPAPTVEAGNLLVAVAYSLVSTGTEIAGLKGSQQKQIKKVLLDPKLIKRGLRMLATRGFKATMGKVKTQIIESLPSPTGYSCSGFVLEVGKSVEGFKVGDRVACGGAGLANHAEVVSVPRNLVVQVPDGCSLRDASSVTLGAIAMQGVRRANVALGERVGVIGLGLVGQLTVRLLACAGCHVMGCDPVAGRTQKALAGGAEKCVISGGSENPVEAAQGFTGGIGLDAVIITAATPSSELVQQAMEMTRRKGRVVVVGDVGLALQRHPFYDKEIDFLISCSYGPGRYDTSYEIEGKDYPIGYVRWTENRNMAEYLELVSRDKINFGEIVEKEYTVEDAPSAYQALREDEARPLAVILKYGDEETAAARKADTKVSIAAVAPRTGVLRTAVVGAGSLAQAMHLPNLKKLSKYYQVAAVVDKDARVAQAQAKKFGASYCSTNFNDILDDKNIDLVLISTRHNLHVEMSAAALRAGKAVFVEKPMAMNEAELALLAEALEQTNSPYMVGFNRRYAPCSQKAKSALEKMKDAGIILYRVNAGYFPPETWVHGAEGGGRVIGEGCHFVDLISYYAGSRITSVKVAGLGERKESKFNLHDNLSVLLEYENGFVGSLTYLASGNTEMGKERIEVHCGGVSIVIDDFKDMRFYGIKDEVFHSGAPEKGHLEELEFFAEKLKAGERFPIPLAEMIEATQVSFQIDHALRYGEGSCES
ncbi:MAG: Gfo/Idh/MocA family oxidoreductase [bacterium]